MLVSANLHGCLVSSSAQGLHATVWWRTALLVLLVRGAFQARTPADNVSTRGTAAATWWTRGGIAYTNRPRSSIAARQNVPVLFFLCSTCLHNCRLSLRRAAKHDPFPPRIPRVHFFLREKFGCCTASAALTTNTPQRTAPSDAFCTHVGTRGVTTDRSGKHIHQGPAAPTSLHATHMRGLCAPSTVADTTDKYKAR